MKTLIGIFVALLAVGTDGIDRPPDRFDLEIVRALPVQYDGRYMPLDTLARDVVETVTGRTFFEGRDPVFWLLAWTFEPQGGRKQPLIRLSNAELRAELQLSPVQTVFSYDELLGHQPFLDLLERLNERSRGKPDPLETKVDQIHKQLVMLQQVFTGRLICPIPHAGDPNGMWTPIGASLPDASEQIRTAQELWSRMGEAFRAGDAAAFRSAAQRLQEALVDLPAAYRPDPRKIATELRYNRLRPFRTAWIIMWSGAALAALALWIRRRWFDVLAAAGLFAGFIVLTYGLVLRWQIAGRIPAANMYESLLFLGWGTGAFAIVAALIFRRRLIPLTASVMGALALTLADCLPLDAHIRPIVPVLMDTIWMSIHVPIIMVSYSILALAMLIAHIQLVVMAVAPRRRSWIEAIDGMHYGYILIGSFLLLAGIITGSIWGASSWGRYWGWDPKEVWSLIAFLAYLAILHVRADREKTPITIYATGLLLAIAAGGIIVLRFAPLSIAELAGLLAAAVAVAFFVMARNPYAAALKSVMAFWLLIMTYVGVNYVLGIGLHSYGFGTGAVARYMFTIGGIDLAFAVGCYLFHVGRERIRETSISYHGGL